MEKFYITTAIDYCNAAPHIGHAYEKIVADVIARQKKQVCDDVYFLIGTDEHGTKIEKTALSCGVEPQNFCDENAMEFKKAWGLLDIDYNQFIRTTDPEHKKRVQMIFKKLLENGDIYKASYKGLYCAGCESFLSEKDLVDGLCPNHNVAPQLVEEENYFFKLTKYKDAIINHIKTHPEFIQPEFRAKEVLNQLEDIQDISVSRSRESLSWGISVPEDDSQIIYVWIDALSNYITALGYPDGESFKKYWPADCQVIGKDILKFHAIYWPAMLMALGIDLPKTLFAHGWITVDEQKMGKSLGNAISPESLIKEFGLQNGDAIRYFFSAATTFGKDGNFSDEDFKNKVNSDLANNMGNLLNRSLSMLCKYFDGEIKNEFVSDKLKENANLALEKTAQAFEKYSLEQAAEAIISFVNDVNKYVNDSAPWALAKDEKMVECGEVIYNTLESMRFVAVLIYPFCPNIAQDIWKQLSCEGVVSDIQYKDLVWGGLNISKIASKDSVKPVFLRLDSEIAGDKKKKC